jgi:salicylate biosynthesis isochorismate synthase
MMVTFPAQPISDTQVRFRDLVRGTRLGNEPTLVSVTERAEQIDPITLFDRARMVTTDRFFWSQSDGGITLVGLGIAWAQDAVEGSGFRQIQTSWRHLLNRAVVEASCGLPGTGPLLYGGFSFDPQHPKDVIWQNYPNGRMVLPRLLLTLHEGEAWLTRNVVLDLDSDIAAEIATTEALSEVLQALDIHRTNANDPVAVHVSQVTTHELQSAARWKAQVARSALDIAEGKLGKVVLARSIRLETSNPFDTTTALRRLSAQYAKCFVFAFARGDTCFLGATPERLLQVREGQIKTMALAGSLRRGATPDEDRTLGESLLGSSKDQEEHAVVVRTMTKNLADLCDMLDIPSAPSLLRLQNVQHLCTPITGKLRDGVTLLDAVERLHPTPAMGGYPREIALSIIREREGFDRGWYAGPIGWVDWRDDGEFAVAIRSALTKENEAYLFAGCGIMADSDPEREYAESCWKLQPMLSALTGKTL